VGRGGVFLLGGGVFFLEVCERVDLAGDVDSAGGGFFAGDGVLAKGNSAAGGGSISVGDGFVGLGESAGGGVGLGESAGGGVCGSGESSAAGGGGIFAGDSFALEGIVGDGFFAAVDSPGGGFNLAVDSAGSVGDSAGGGFFCVGGGVFGVVGPTIGDLSAGASFNVEAATLSSASFNILNEGGAFFALGERLRMAGGGLSPANFDSSSCVLAAAAANRLGESGEVCSPPGSVSTSATLEADVVSWASWLDSVVSFSNKNEGEGSF